MNLKEIYQKISRRLKRFFIGISDYEEIDSPEYILDGEEILGSDPEISDIQLICIRIKKWFRNQ